MNTPILVGQRILHFCRAAFLILGIFTDLSTETVEEGQIAWKSLKASSISCHCRVIPEWSTSDYKEVTVECANFTDLAELCINRRDLTDRGKVIRLRLINAPNFVSTTVLNLTEEVLVKELKIQPEELREIIITNTSVTNIRICHESRMTIIGHQLRPGIVLPCKRFRSLTTLDVRDNYIKHLFPLHELKNLQKIMLSGNMWSCFDEKPSVLFQTMKWLLPYAVRVRDAKATYCRKPNSNKWHQNASSASKYINVTLIYFLQFHQEMTQDCPEQCDCNVMNINTPLWVEVTCVNASLKYLPQSLPSNTQVLDVSHNQISDLLPVTLSSSYKHLKELTANQNQILTLSDLAGSPFLVKNKPTTLKLQYNLLTEFDVDLLEPTFSEVKKLHFQDSLSFLFAGNPWDCGCDSLKQMQEFIYKYRVLMRDAEYLACGKAKSPKLISANFEAMCRPPTMDYMPFIIAVEAVLLVLILLKLAFDAHRYKRTGELPWLARNMCVGYSGLLKPKTRPTCSTILSCYEEARDTGCCVQSDDQISNYSEEGDVRSDDSQRSGKRRQKQFLDAFRPRRNTAPSTDSEQSGFRSAAAPVISRIPSPVSSKTRAKIKKKVSAAGGSSDGGRSSSAAEDRISLREAVEAAGGHF